MAGLGESLKRLLDEPGTLGFVQVAVLLMARLVPLTLFSPLFGGGATPLRFRLGLGAAMALALAPLVQMESAPLPEAEMLLLTAKELLFGATLAVLVSAIFGFFAASGSFFDRARGLSGSDGFDDVEGLQVFFKLFFVTLFFAVGGHRILLSAFGDGLVRLPLDGLVEGGATAAFMDPVQIAALTGELFAASLQLALPLIAIALVVDVALAILGRAAGDIGVFFLGLTIKGILGVAVLLLMLGLGTEVFLEAVPPLVRRLAEMR